MPRVRGLKYRKRFKKSHSHKTKRRLEIKRLMLEAKPKKRKHK